jgi:hypothetical protein
MPRSEQEDIRIGIRTSPRGIVTVGMSLENTDWLLLTTQNIMIADRSARELREKYSIRSILGLPFDVNIANRERVLKLATDQSQMGPKISLAGLYVESEKFDELAVSTPGLMDVH